MALQNRSKARQVIYLTVVLLALLAVSGYFLE